MPKYAAPTKYTTTMCFKLIELFKKGGGRENFCAQEGISEPTFTAWLKKHEDFEIAYDIAKQKAHAWFMDKALSHLEEENSAKETTVTLNTRLWSMIMRNRFGFTEHRKVKIPGIGKAKNFGEQMKAILNELGNGNLTASEANQLSKLIEVGIKVYEVTEIDRRLTQVEQQQRIGVSDDDFKLEPEKI